MKGKESGKKEVLHSPKHTPGPLQPLTPAQEEPSLLNEEERNKATWMLVLNFGAFKQLLEYISTFQRKTRLRLSEYL